MASGVPQGSVFGPLLLILYTFELFHIIGTHIVGYADDTTIYAVIARQSSRRQVTELLNQYLAAVKFGCLKWHMRLNPKKAKSKLIIWSGTIAPGYGDLTLGGADLEELKSLHYLGLTYDSKWMLPPPLSQ